MKEIFKDIPGYKDLYQASNLGNIKSFYGKTKILKGFPNKNGYLQIDLRLNGKRKVFRIHRLVLLTFIGPSNGLVCNHIDGNKANNNLENLEWCTLSENMKHAYDNGLKIITKNHNFIKNNIGKEKKGDKHFNNKKIIQLDKNGNFIKEWNSITIASNYLSLTHTPISRVCRGLNKTAGGYKWEYLLYNI